MNLRPGVTLIATLCDFWRVRSQALEASYYLEQALKQHPDSAVLHYWYGLFQGRLGNQQAEVTGFQTAIKLAEATGELDVIALSYSQLGCGGRITNIEDAYELQDHVLSLCQQISNPQTLAICHNALGTLFYELSNKNDEAIAPIQQAREIFEQIGDLRGISVTTYNLSLLYDRQGEVQRAQQHCEQSLELKQQIGDRAGVARRLSVMASWNIQEEEFERALEQIAESRAICEEIGERPRLAYTLSREGLLRLIMTDFDEAQVVIENGLQVATAINNAMYIESFHSYLAFLHLMQRQLSQAKPHIEQALHAHNRAASGWLSLLAYANYLAHTGNVDAGVPVAAVLSQHVRENDPSDRYFLSSLIYRLQQRIGNDAWQQAVNATTGMTIEQLYQNVMNDLQL